ncbi:hypothetical protein [Mycobacteroides abscessus]|uniref:hypothetical protein n=1 Tax=Mycobacteroides abscessus TaxID=36809 RepID=UPI000D3E368F|nr:hypothetical protein [Mycobacteroides abscessus]PVA66178.1 hypothetical protein DDJ87_08590 [Mycobacteroides abscessus]
MQKPTKAFADMLHELADKLQAVLAEMYPAADNQGALFVSPNSLRATAEQYAENAEREGIAEQMAQQIATAWTNSPQYMPTAIERARPLVAVILATFDVTPKAGR